MSKNEETVNLPNLEDESSIKSEFHVFHTQDYQYSNDCDNLTRQEDENVAKDKQLVLCSQDFQTRSDGRDFHHLGKQKEDGSTHEEIQVLFAQDCQKSSHNREVDYFARQWGVNARNSKEIRVFSVQDCPKYYSYQGTGSSLNVEHGELSNGETIAGNAGFENWSAKENTTANGSGAVLPLVKVTDSFQVDSVVNGRSKTSIAGLSLELNDLKGKHRKITKERNSLQQKKFELQSEVCSVEIEWDLEKERSRFLDEQISSLNSSLLLKESELSSLRKRYQLLNEGFLNSETLREGLQKDVDELTKIVGGLKERLGMSKSIVDGNKNNLEDATIKVSQENEEKVPKLESEIDKVHLTLKKEKNSTANLQEMFSNVEQERNLLLREIEDLRIEHQKQQSEVNLLKNLLYEKNKQGQISVNEEQQSHKKLEENQKQQSKAFDELRKSTVYLKSKISSLEYENRTLEEELYQQLAALEKLGAENKLFIKSRKEISDKLTVLGFHTIEEIIAEYSVLNDSANELKRKIRELEQDEISKQPLELSSFSSCVECLHLQVNSRRLSCVPRSENIKLKFVLKSVTEELNKLKHESESQIAKKQSVSGKIKGDAWKKENRVAKKWLRTMKDSMNALVEDEDLPRSTVLLENQLHEANIQINALKHEVKMSKKANDKLVRLSKKREGEMELLKQQLVESETTKANLLKNMKAKITEAQKKFKEEVQKSLEMKENVVYFEEQNKEILIHFEKIKQKSLSLQKEKDRAQNNLESLKAVIWKNFGSLYKLALQNAKERSVDYVQIIEMSKDKLIKLTQELNSLHQINTVLREELQKVRIQLKNKEELLLQNNSKESIFEKRYSDQIQFLMQTLKNSKKNEVELLAMHKKEKEERQSVNEEVMNLNFELHEIKMVLSEKEKECEMTVRIMQELEASCKLYEVEFEKSGQEDEKSSTENVLPLDENQDDDSSEGGSDSIAENFQVMQEALHERMVTKMKRLQNRFHEALAVVASSQKLNMDLQKRLHDAEKMNFEKDEVDSRTSVDEFIETILGKLSEKEREIQQMLQICVSEDVKHELNDNEQLLSAYEETIKQLKIENGKTEVRLIDANKKIDELEEKLAKLQNIKGNVDLLKDTSQNEWVLVASKENLIQPNEYPFMVSNDNLKKKSHDFASNVYLTTELQNMNEKYVNLKAAFEECLRKLEILDGAGNEKETEKADTVNTVGRYMPSNSFKELVSPTFISPLLESNERTAGVLCNECKETTNFEKYEQAKRNPSFSKISCAFKEDDSETGSIESGCMVIELTVTEEDINSVEITRNPDRILQRHLEQENIFVKETLQKFANERTAISLNSLNQVNELSLLEEKLLQLGKEKQLLKNEVAVKGEQMFVLNETVDKLHKELKIMRDDGLNQANEISLFEAKLIPHDKENNSLESGVEKCNNELIVCEATTKKLKEQNSSLESNTIERDSEILSLRELNVSKLYEEKRSYTNSIARLEEELIDCKGKLKKLNVQKADFSYGISEQDSQMLLLKENNTKLQITVDELQNMKRASDDELLKRNVHISSLESRVFHLETENGNFKVNIVDKADKISTLCKNIEKFEQDRKYHENAIAEENEKKLSLTKNIDEITKVNLSLEIDLHRQKTELSLLAGNLKKLQEANKSLENNKIQLNAKLSDYEIKIEKYKEEISLLQKDLQEASFEKERLANKMRELNKKTKCNEEEFEKLVGGYLEEIDSWKIGFASLEEDMSILQNELERIQNEKHDLEILVKEMSDSRRKMEEQFQESNLTYFGEVESWKLKMCELESDSAILGETVKNLEHECESSMLEIDCLNREKNEIDKMHQEKIKTLKSEAENRYKEREISNKAHTEMELEFQNEEGNSEERFKEMVAKFQKEIENYKKRYQEMVTKFEKQRDSSEKVYNETVIKFQTEIENMENQRICEKEKEMGNLRMQFETKLHIRESQFGTKVNELSEKNLKIEQLGNDVLKKDEEIFHLKMKVGELEGSLVKQNGQFGELQQEFVKTQDDLMQSTVLVDKMREETRMLSEIVSEKDKRVLNLDMELSDHNKQLEKLKKKLSNLETSIQTLEIKDLKAHNDLTLKEKEIDRLQKKIHKQNLEDKNLEKHIKNKIEKDQENIRVIVTDIDETAKIKLNLEGELQALRSKIDVHSEEKVRLEMNVSSLKEVTEVLTKRKLTLLEEIERLSNQKKEGQQLVNSEFSRSSTSSKELQNNNEGVENENSQLIVQISSLKVGLATVQKAYEQSQDEINNYKTRLEEAIAREKQERDSFEGRSEKIEDKLKYLEERNKSLTVENRNLSLSKNETLQAEIQMLRKENVVLGEGLKQQESENIDLDLGKSSSQSSTLRKKLKEIRAKFSKEKKQRELHKFEIINLKEKVERLTNRELENETQTEKIRKTLLEVKTERDGLLVDIDCLNKRKNKDTEGYTSKIEALENELRLLKGKESKEGHNKKTEDSVSILNEEKKILQLKLSSNQDRHLREVSELKTKLESLQSRYNTTVKRLERTETANQKEILALKKSLSAIERENENQKRELETLYGNLEAINKEKENIKNLVVEKNSELSKWKKETLNGKAEIKFLKGSLNILEKEGLTVPLDATRDTDTSE